MKGLFDMKPLYYAVAIGVLAVLAVVSFRFLPKGASPPDAPPSQVLSLTGSGEQTSSAFLVSNEKWRIAVTLTDAPESTSASAANAAGPIPTPTATSGAALTPAPNSTASTPAATQEPFVMEVLNDKKEVVQTLEEKDLSDPNRNGIEMSGAGFYTIHVRSSKTYAIAVTQ